MDFFDRLHTVEVALAFIAENFDPETQHIESTSALEYLFVRFCSNKPSGSSRLDYRFKWDKETKSFIVVKPWEMEKKERNKEIIRLLSSRWSQSQIALFFDCDRATISNIARSVK